MRLRHQRAELRRGIGWITNPQRFHASNEGVTEFVVDGSFDQQSRSAQADLPAVLEGRTHEGVEMVAPVGIGEHQCRVLATEFQRYLLQQWRRQCGDALADRSAAGEGNRLRLRMRHQCFANRRTGAVHEVEHSRGEADIRGDFRQQGRAVRRHFRWLGHHAIARSECRRDFPGEQIQRQVPWRNRRHHAQWLSQGEVESGFAVMRFAGELGRGMSEETQVGDRARNLDVARQRDWFSAIARFGLRDFIQSRFKRIGQPLQPSRALRIRQR